MVPLDNASHVSGAVVKTTSTIIIGGTVSLGEYVCTMFVMPL